MIKAVIFDLDGTLIDSERPAKVRWEKVFKELTGQDMPIEFWDACLGLAREDENKHLLKYLKCARKVELFHELTKRTEIPPPKLGVVECLEKLYNSGIKLGVATSSSLSSAYTLLFDNDLCKYFQVVITLDQVKRAKPSSECYVKACRELGVYVNQAIAVEDSNTGVLAALAAGISTVFIRDTVDLASDLREKVWQCPSISDLLALVNRLHPYFK